MPTPTLTQIKASAGSGKTYTLTRRFLALLADARDEDGRACALAVEGGHCWPDILAVTFTNKAASEMKERVIRLLKEHALADPAQAGKGDDGAWPPARAARWVDIILRRYGALNIRTIDSLLTMLVRLAALELSLPPDFEPSFSPDEYFEPLYDLILDRARRGDAQLRDDVRDACRLLLFHTDLKGFTVGTGLRMRLSQLLQLHLAEGGMSAPGPFDEDAHRGGLPDVDTDALAAKLVAIHTDMRDATAALSRILAEEQLSAAANLYKFLDKCAENGAFSPLSKSAYLEKGGLDDCLLKKSKGIASDEARAAFDAWRDACNDFAVRGRLIQRALQVAPLAGLARAMAAHLPDFQRREGKLPQPLIPLHARDVLNGEFGVSEAFCRMGTRLAHILIDEFQDTSRDQWAAIEPLAVECLSRGGGLTWVGDVKQAIYGWRGGDSALFDDILASPALTAIVPTPKRDTLPRNWRSRVAIVQHNNLVFAQLDDPLRARGVLSAMLGDKTPGHVLDEAAASVARAFAGAAQGVPDRTSAQGGLVRMVPVAGEDNADLRDKVRQQLRALFLDDLAARRPWRDVAVLVRKNDESALVASWLMDWGVPVVTENSLRLADHPLVTQTVALLAFLDYPPNALALWEVLTGEELLGGVSGLSGRTLRDWLADRSARAADDPRGGKGLLADFRATFPAAWETWLAPFYARAGLMGPYDTVREIFERFRVAQRHPEDIGYVRRFLEVVHNAESRGLTSLATFLEFWTESGGEEKVPMPEAMDAVRVMTMHKSKGLEFPVVVIPFHHQPDRTDPPLVVTELDGQPLLAPLCPEMGDRYHRAQAAAAAEKLHLLYVGWTRPVDELHAYVTSTPFAEKNSSLLAGVRALLTGCGIGTEQEYVTGAVPPARETGAQGEAEAQAVPPDVPDAPPPPSPLPSPDQSPDQSPDTAPWRPMQWLPRLKIFRNQLEEFTFTERRRGMLVHACLEQLRLTGSPDQDAARAVAHGMRAFPLPVPEPEATARELTAMLAWLAALPQAAHWFTHGVPEQSIMDAQGSIHRTDLMVDDGQTCTVVEWKTGRPSDDHVAQVRRYLGLLAEAAGRGPGGVRGVLVYLDGRVVRPVELPAAPLPGTTSAGTTPAGTTPEGHRP
ncbi:UvrD-helicase domain-containing protein [Nitratidesulfovibrio sp. D1]|uniref:UvrD-helicase domain-containing protein n=1 Tax=Nitratidesulfovibrio sp. D1 TaxID=3440151 RepID=UPI003EBEE534